MRIKHYFKYFKGNKVPKATTANDLYIDIQICINLFSLRDRNKENVTKAIKPTPLGKATPTPSSLYKQAASGF